MAVALPSATSLFYVEILKGVKDALRDRDIDLLLCNLGSTRALGDASNASSTAAPSTALLLVSLPVEGEVAEPAARAMQRAGRARWAAAATGFDSLLVGRRGGARSATST